MTKRLVWADIIRILGVYLIIVLHVTAIDTSSNPIFLPALAFINTNVPLLVLLSGALLLTKSETYSVFFKKRVSRVLIPWIFWSALFTFLVLVFNQIEFIAIPGTFRAIFIPLFWFMTMLIGLYAITPALRIFLQKAKKKDIWLIIAVWFFAVSLLPYLRNTEAFPASPDNGIVRLVITFTGYYLLGHQIMKLKKSAKNKNILLITLILGLLAFSATQLMQFQNGYINYSLPTIVVTSTSLFGLIYLYRDRAERISPRLKEIIQIISKTTLGIFFIHFLFIERLAIPSILNGGYLVDLTQEFNPFINGAIIFIISFVIIFGLSRISKLRKLIGYA